MLNRISQLSVPYLARASMKSSTSGTIINVNGPDITLDPGAALAHRLSLGGTFILNEIVYTMLANIPWSYYLNIPN